ncbi:GspL cytoplasmic actin-ATPase-like region [Sulfitobacter sp. THAF37]|uniref:type II secretion system protein GspL n=1 Tax=Sulfitobacter sp. THAF37 TaxID=2587855 RepID=UPI0012A9DBEF|nr:type II secretion system protein GspL [Sulfitobacter sp. THAF37]QFT58110.1 GspL cytoplasmic actin-ATPase-like region [Sulfitobacter sp. THAF37]
MTNQDISIDNTASGRPAVLPDHDTDDTPRIAIGPKLQQRAATAQSRGGPIRLLPTELVGVHLVRLPKSRARQRPALLTFAVEERIGVPIDRVRVIEGPHDTKDGQALAMVCDRQILDRQAGQRLLPDFLLIPRPRETDWAVWQEDERAIVRTSEGAGFAVAASALPLLWRRAGRPSVTSLHDPVPEEMDARDVSSAPPPPDAADLAFSFDQQNRKRTQLRRLGVSAAAICILAALSHLVFLAADTWALRNLAAEAQQRAQAAVAERLPGVTLTADAGPILARLSPRAQAPERGTFLPLLTRITAALAETDKPLSFRRLAWSTQNDEMVVLVQSSGLTDLQAVQQNLEAQGFTVRSGAASASDGGAEAELRISEGAS